MKTEDIIEAEQEAKRFLKRLKEVKQSFSNKDAFSKNTDYKWIRGCKETGALKRSSMDLTRALAKMRNPNY